MSYYYMSDVKVYRRLKTLSSRDTSFMLYVYSLLFFFLFFFLKKIYIIICNSNSPLYMYIVLSYVILMLFTSCNPECNKVYV